MRSNAKTVEEYLSELLEDRHEAIKTVRAVILKHLPEGYVETMNWGMICYEVPLSVEPQTYNGQPLMYAALASQKRHMAVYLSCLHCDETRLEWFMEEYKKTGKKLNMGKSCVRFTKLENLPLELIGEVVARVPMTDFVKSYKDSRKKK